MGRRRTVVGGRCTGFGVFTVLFERASARRASSFSFNQKENCSANFGGMKSMLNVSLEASLEAAEGAAAHAWADFLSNRVRLAAMRATPFVRALPAALAAASAESAELLVTLGDLGYIAGARGPYPHNQASASSFSAAAPPGPRVAVRARARRPSPEARDAHPHPPTPRPAQLPTTLMPSERRPDRVRRACAHSLPRPVPLGAMLPPKTKLALFLCFQGRARATTRRRSSWRSRRTRRTSGWRRPPRRPLTRCACAPRRSYASGADARRGWPCHRNGDSGTSTAAIDSIAAQKRVGD